MEIQIHAHDYVHFLRLKNNFPIRRWINFSVVRIFMLLNTRAFSCVIINIFMLEPRYAQRNYLDIAIPLLSGNVVNEGRQKKRRERKKSF